MRCCCWCGDGEAQQGPLTALEALLPAASQFEENPPETEAPLVGGVPRELRDERFSSLSKRGYLAAEPCCAVPLLHSAKEPDRVVLCRPAPAVGERDTVRLMRSPMRRATTVARVAGVRGGDAEVT